MNLYRKKIPRGIIYHSFMQSLRYLFFTIFKPLNDSRIIQDFQTNFSKINECKYCIAFPFARTALFFILKHLELSAGSKIIMPPITIKGILDVVSEIGLIPVYVELDPNTICFDLEDLEKKIDQEVKVAIITPLFGLVPDLEAMIYVLKKNNVFVIEDFSQCLNGYYNGRRVGTFGNIGIYSSSSIKTLDTLGGGLVITNDESLYTKLCVDQQDLQAPTRIFLIKKAIVNLIRNFATTQPWFTLFTFPLLQIIGKFNPDLVLKQTGNRHQKPLKKLPKLWFNAFSSLQAEIGIECIKAISSNDECRISNAEYLRSIFNDRFPRTHKNSRNVYWQLLMHTVNAQHARIFFGRKGIDVATTSLELISGLSHYPNKIDLPIAHNIYFNGIFIPCFPSVSNADRKCIEKAIKEYSSVIGIKNLEDKQGTNSY